MDGGEDWHVHGARRQLRVDLDDSIYTGVLVRKKKEKKKL